MVFITETESVYCAVRTGSLDINRIRFSLGDVMTQVVDPSSAEVGFVVDKVAVGQVFHLYVSFSTFRYTPSMLHTHLLPYVALIRRTSGRNMKTLQKQCSFGNL